MTDAIEQKALALVNEVRAERGQDVWRDVGDRKGYGTVLETLCRAIEQHEAYRQQVSDAVELRFAGHWRVYGGLARFIVAKPDPLVEVFDECFHQEVREGETWSEAMARKFRAASEKRGGKIGWGEG